MRSIRNTDDENQEKGTSKTKFCPPNMAITSVKCDDSFCGIITIGCREAEDGSGNRVSFENDESNCFGVTASEEQERSYQRCNKPNHFVRGLKCEGQYCDDVTIFCCPVKEVVTQPPASAASNAGRPNTQTPTTCGKNQFVKTVKCEGGDCAQVTTRCEQVKVDKVSTIGATLTKV